MSEPVALPAFKDNYIWCLRQENKALVVDPGDPQVVLTYLASQQLELNLILITHHHWDHVDGIQLLRQHYPQARVLLPAAEQHKIAAAGEGVAHGDIIHWQQYQFQVMAVPGHTLGHLAYYCAPWLFCGDTLFNAGCGRLFEGTAEQMWHSLNQLMALPADTWLYPTHEYTLANLEFARWADPNNPELERYQKQSKVQRDRGEPTLPTRLSDQLRFNPYLRAVDPVLQQHWQQENALELFRFLRQRKDQW
ncbi:hydroxyacylglutathione hydrolase [Rheinheimera sp.]|uniref:hydroxyacylglutathione hydrolase n=1 Tax=Rheinheimera sp. TaxID=1869214 RepID=UPI00307EC479